MKIAGFCPHPRPLSRRCGRGVFDALTPCPLSRRCGRGVFDALTPVPSPDAAGEGSFGSPFPRREGGWGLGKVRQALRQEPYCLRGKDRNDIR